MPRQWKLEGEIRAPSLLARTGATRNRLLREKNCRCLDERSLARSSRVQPLCAERGGSKRAEENSLSRCGREPTGCPPGCNAIASKSAGRKSLNSCSFLVGAAASTLLSHKRNIKCIAARVAVSHRRYCGNRGATFVDFAGKGRLPPPHNDRSGNQDIFREQRAGRDRGAYVDHNFSFSRRLWILRSKSGQLAALSARRPRVRGHYPWPSRAACRSFA